jgi:O-acetyl-ADP-ribose deacetylase (regulator of RNase III)
MSISYIFGDITNCNAEVIVQQSNCLTINAKGLAKTLADKFNINHYSKRRPLYGNLAIKEDRDIPGTIRIDPVTSSPHIKYVVSFFSQFSQGKPGVYHDNIKSDHVDKNGNVVIDNSNQRILWFKQCLDQLGAFLVSKGITSVAFPFMIGCGLAGGDWNVYHKMIIEFAITYKDNFTVMIVTLGQ